ncbi:MAG TPA: CPBP family intramembrane glutamic endopeptidase, partial [Methanocella sp.]|nr:CPBP family intramembrane glutamic endopeptidase [Methanocella sp.]
KQYLFWVPILIVWSFAAWGLTAPAVAWMTQNLLGWLPGWFTTASDFSGYSRDVLLVTLGLNLAVNGIIAPIVEELYFRGHLLPRIGRYGRWAPVLSALLFTLYHFWQPMIYLPVLLAMLPMIYLVWRKQDVRFGIGAHCGLNLIGALSSFAMYLA